MIEVPAGTFVYDMLISSLRKRNPKNPKRQTGGERRKMLQPEIEGDRCKRHPMHLTSIGVCPYCLREALSRLFSAAPSGSCAASSTTSSSPYFSLSFFDVSPSYNDLKRSRPSFHFKRSVEDRESVGRSDELTKSQSLVLARGRNGENKEKQEKGEEEEEEEERKEKKGGFWSKLLSASSKRREEGVASLHSKTSKQKPSTRCV